jgi:hypothetical protein
MQIKFVRSGGFAGTATSVEGEVEFSGSDAQVTSTSCGYRRELPSHEVQQLQSLVSRPFPVAAEADSPPARDLYQYQIVIVKQDGQQQEFTVGQHSEESAMVPTDLVKWIGNEANRIWMHRVAIRPR